MKERQSANIGVDAQVNIALVVKLVILALLIATAWADLKWNLAIVKLDVDRISKRCWTVAMDQQCMAQFAADNKLKWSPCTGR